MKRLHYEPKTGWLELAKQQQLPFPSLEEMHCTEAEYFAFRPEEIAALKLATEALLELTDKALRDIFENDRLREFEIDPKYHDFLKADFGRAAEPLIGRFDFSFGVDGKPKLLEYNCDTPALLSESAALQSAWKEAHFASSNDWNELESKIAERFARFSQDSLVFCAQAGLMYDELQTRYLMRLAEKAGKQVSFQPLSELYYDERQGDFTFDPAQPLGWLYKFYPWEWMLADDEQGKLLSSKVEWVEAPHRILPCCKYFLALLWELFPGHENLLPTFLSAERLSGSYAKKPYFSRRGEGLTLVSKGKSFNSPGPEQSEHFVYQQLCPLPKFDKYYACVSVWTVGKEAVGIGIRESRSPVTDSFSNFIPHLITGE